MCLLIFLCLLYHSLKNSRTRRLNDDPVRFSVLNRGTIDESNQGNSEESNSRETSSGGVDEPNMVETQCSESYHERNGSEPDLSFSVSGSEDKSNRTADSAHQDGRVIASDHPEHTTAVEVQKGIPSSLEGDQRNCIVQGKLVG